MQIIERATTPNGIPIRIEDWHLIYTSSPPASTVVAYPIANVTIPIPLVVSAGREWRAEFNFHSTEEAKAAFDRLKAGEITLRDLIPNLWNPCNAVLL